MKKKKQQEALQPRKPMRLRVTHHLENLENGLLCGCGACLEKDGLEFVQVYSDRGWRTMLVNWFSRRTQESFGPDSTNEEPDGSIHTQSEQPETE